MRTVAAEEQRTAVGVAGRQPATHRTWMRAGTFSGRSPVRHCWRCCCCCLRWLSQSCCRCLCRRVLGPVHRQPAWCLQYQQLAP